ncbi:MAG: hypothetical protein V2I31_04070, partial [Mariniphaga sp.]|nr:hypothetical protein [Mariniphaga sp.]
PMKCQLVQNFYACQIEPNGLSEDERVKIEQMAANVKNGKTNYFQMGKEEFIAGPRSLKKEEKEGKNLLTWQTAYAEDEPLSYYEIVIDGQIAGKVNHKPQTLKSKPFVFETEKTGSEILVAAVDKAGNRMETKLV